MCGWAGVVAGVWACCFEVWEVDSGVKEGLGTRASKEIVSIYELA